jgi:hypothetical protein
MLCISHAVVNTHGVKNDGQIEMHTADPLVAEPNFDEVEFLLKS